MSEDYSAHYKRFHNESEEHAAEMARWLCTYLSDDLPDDRSLPALDVGCGFGFGLRALKMVGFHDIRGIEISQQQGEIARRSGCEVSVVADAVEYLNEHPAQFGVILLLDVLEHVPVNAQINLLNAIRGALLQGGRLIMTVPNANSPLAARWRYIDFTHHASFTEHSLHYALGSAGFEEIRLDNAKGIGAFPARLWKKSEWKALRKWLVRSAWYQLFKAELHESEDVDQICFELNLKAVAVKEGQIIASKFASGKF